MDWAEVMYVFRSDDAYLSVSLQHLCSVIVCFCSAFVHLCGAFVMSLYAFMCFCMPLAVF